MEIDAEGVTSGQFMPHLKSVAKRVWELYPNGAIREFYFREDRSAAVWVLASADAIEARQRLESRPLVKARLITFDIVPFGSYPGLKRLFRGWMPVILGGLYYS
jgi:hypothetical protein